MTILLSDPRVSAVPVHDNGEPLVRLDSPLSPSRTLVRAGLASRLAAADAALPAGVRLLVIEGHRSADQIIDVVSRLRVRDGVQVLQFWPPRPSRRGFS